MRPFQWPFLGFVSLSLLLSKKVSLAASDLKSPETIPYKTCVVKHQEGGDDVPALQTLLSECSSNARVLFQQGTTYNISTPVAFGQLTNVEISIEGNLDLPQNIHYVQGIVSAAPGSSIHWFSASGTNVTLSGNQDSSWGWTNAYGKPWWKAAQLTDPGGLALRPHLWSLDLQDSVVRWLKVKDPIAWNFAISGNNVHIYNITIDASYDLSNPFDFPFNTDGFDISGTNFLLEDSQIFNGDDCVAVNNGAHNVTVRGFTCEGGHGVSLSGTDDISDVLFDNIYSRNSLYATRFKSSLDSTGTVTNVTWSNIHVLNATFPVFATSVYFDQNTNRGRTPSNQFPPNSTATHISDFSWINVTGTINSEHPGDGSCTTIPCYKNAMHHVGYAIEGTTNTEGIVLQLLNGSATNIQTRNINLMPIDGVGTVDVYCDSLSFTDGTKNLGFKCKNGAYEPV